MESLPAGTGDTTYTFSVPTSGAVTGTHLHMRVMLSEDATGAPCAATYGQTCDFFFIIGSGCTMPVLSFRPSSHDTVSNCAGGAGITLSASGVGIGGTFVWSPASGLSASTGSTVTANPATTTVYSVAGTSTGTCTATYLDTVVVISTGRPADTIHYPSGRFCVGDTVLLTGTTGPGYTYQWFHDGMLVRRRGAFYFATSPGTYTLVISAYGCADTSAPVTLNFNPAPAPVATYSGGMLRVTGAYTTYQWLNNALAIPGATADSLVPTADGYYDVVVTDTNGCTGTSNFVSIVKTAVTNINNAAAITVYPNPAGSILHIQSPFMVKAIITGIEGTVVMEERNARDMDISRLTPGIYFIQLFDGSGHRVGMQRVVKN